jgi:glycosyltransferase involved in cell wall biosynthesis
VSVTGTKPAVLQLISSGGFYGAESVLLGLASQVRDWGWRSAVCVLESPGAAALRERAAAEGLAVTVLPAGLYGAWTGLRRLVAREGFDLVHSHGYKTNVIAALGIGAGVGRVATCHGWLSDSLKLRVYEWLDRMLLRRFDHVVAVSPQVLEKLDRGGIRQTRRSLVENGARVPAIGQPARDALRQQLCPSGEPLIVRVGRLDAFKGNDLLLEAVARLNAPSPRLAFVGDGPEREALAVRAAKLGLAERVVFLGYREDAAALLAAADLMVISSRSEGLPIVMLEAMGLGVPIVATSVGSIPKVLQDGSSAWLISPGDAEALSRALASALADPTEARRRANRAHEAYLERYSLEAMGRRYAAVYEQVLGGSR